MVQKTGKTPMKWGIFEDVLNQSGLFRVDCSVGQSGAEEKLVPNVADLALYAAFALAEHGGVTALAQGDEVCALAKIGIEAVIDFVEVERGTFVLQIDHDVGKAVGQRGA